MLIQELWENVADVMLEPGGFQSPLVSADDFLGYYREVVSDFLGRSGLIKGLALVAQQTGLAGYTVPDFLNDIDETFSDGASLFRDDENSISGRDLRWQARVGTPRSWFQDKMTTRDISIYPAPTVARNAQGTDPGIIVAWVPGGDLTQVTAFIGTLNQTNQSATYTSPGTFFDAAPPTNTSRGNLAMLGKVGLLTENVDLDNVIEHLVDDFVIFIKYGILAKVFGVDGENRDVLRERYCAARYEEGVMLGKAMMAEEIESQ